MNHFFKALCILFIPVLLGATVLPPAPLYRLCIDGGGSKTMLQVLDRRGEVMPLLQDGRVIDRVTVGGSNVNVIGEVGLRKVLEELFADVRLHDVTDQPLLFEVMPNCFLYAGMSGLGLESNKAIARNVFSSFGINPENMVVMADAEMAREYLGDNGITLIAGTGSICFGQRDGNNYRVGGLGRVLGDEGSCYEIGLKALRAALAEEYGWGKNTSLSAALHVHVGAVELKRLIPGINAGTTPSSTLAALAPIVCEQAVAGDKIAKKIMKKTKHNLVKLVRNMIRIGGFSDTRLCCWGGLFKSVFADEIIHEIVAMAAKQGCSVTVENHAQDNLPVLYVRSRA